MLYRKNHRPVLSSVICVLVLSMTFAGLAHAQELPPLIPRVELFGNPEKAQARISPDGMRMSYLAPHNGVLNVWVKTVGQNDDKVITADTLRGIRIHFWAEDNQHIFYMQDVGGNENWHIYAVNLQDGSVGDLTPHENIQAGVVATDPNFPHEILIQMNKRNPQLMDVYHLDLNTNDMQLIAENPGNYVGWFTDNNFKLRGAFASTPEGGFQLLVRDTEQDQFREFITWSPEDEGSPYGFTPDGKGLYIGDSRNSDVTRLKIVDIATKNETEVAFNPEVDLGSVMINPITYHLEAVSFNKDRDRWVILDSSLVPDFQALENLAKGEFAIVSRDRADRNWIVAYGSDISPADFYIYHRETKQGEFIFSSRPKLADYTLAPMTYVEIPTRDGLTLPSFLTLPVGLPGKNLPLILNVHGGPWARDYWGYNSEAQWMANRGYAVLQVNFRGSTGFGKKFLHAGDKEWGRKMQDDLTDAVKWAIDQGIADPKRTCIYGGSYGGYAVLAAAAFTPDLFTCGVDIVGPSNLHTLIASVPPYWAPLLKLFAVRMGDPVADSMMLVERSPLTHADKFVMPLLVGQGANDPRVKQAEAEQIVAALREKGKDVEYVVYPDEGHGFARPENRMDFYGRAEKFLAKYLGGRVEE
jgi:dipeptidyl aminopeptidase/acylaminoacyl peptidase